MACRVADDPDKLGPTRTKQGRVIRMSISESDRLEVV